MISSDVTNRSTFDALSSFMSGLASSMKPLSIAYHDGQMARTNHLTFLDLFATQLNHPLRMSLTFDIPSYGQY
jgi:prephenate dehydrogenase